jgi:heavy metal translocating P-type ATPase
MAMPLAMMRGGGEAARQGILMRSGEAFQVMDQLATIVFDKTGTLTRGEPQLAGLAPADGWDEPGLLELAAAAEQPSEHPLARAIVDAAHARGLTPPEAADFAAHTGEGVEASVAGRRVRVGKPAFVAGAGADFDALAEARTAIEAQGQTVVAVAAGGELAGLLGIGDALKDDAAATVQRLKAARLTPVMVTGDNPRTAGAVAATVGIDEVTAEVLPADKAAQIRQRQESGARVAMVGDGINDAPALTQADVGIAIGAGTDIAIEAADIVVMSERLTAVADAYDIGHRTYRKTKHNLALAFAFNGVGVPAAATGLVHPVWAMAAMLASVTAVLANSFAGRLIGRQPAATGEASEAELAAEGPLQLEVPMHCAGCAARIHDGLGELDVTGIDADAERDLVTVTPRSASQAEVTAKLADLGFSATPAANNGEEST